MPLESPFVALSGEVLAMSWEATFESHITLPAGRAQRTLREAGDYIQTMPSSTQKQERWQTAASVLIDTVKGGPSMFARIAIMRAINELGEPVYDPKRKCNWRKASRR